MALDKTIIEMARTKYAEKWQHDWEQMASRVQPLTTVLTDAPPKGIYWEFPQIGGTEVREYTDGRADMVTDQLAFGKRGMKQRKFYNNIDLCLDEVDDMLNLEYNFEIIRGKQKAAAARFLDMITLGTVKEGSAYRIKTTGDDGFGGGILGDGYAGEDGSVRTSLDLTYASFNAGKGNLIPVDYATTGTGVSKNYAGTLHDRISYMLRRLEELDAFDGSTPGDLCLAISPAVKQMLNAYESVINRDYGFSKLVQGVPTFNAALNATVVVTNMLPTMNTEDKSGAAVNGARMCCAWLKSQVGFGMWKDTEWTLKDVNGKIAVDHALRVRGKAGCARLRDDAVFVLPVVEKMS